MPIFAPFVGVYIGMGTRWIAQKTSTGCGPVALLNIKKWLGNSVSYKKDFQEMHQKCKTKDFGTELKYFVKNLYKIDGIKILPRNYPTTAQLSAYINEDIIILMKAAIPCDDGVIGHYFIISEQTEKSFFCVNVFQKHLWMSKASFDMWFLQKHTYYCHECGVAPYCWILRKI